MKYLFWNVNVSHNKSDKRINPTISLLLQHYQADIAVFAEYVTEQKNELLQLLYETGNEYYHIPQRGCKIINVFSKLTPDHFEQLTDSPRYTLYRVPHPTLGYHILALAHLPSNYRYSEQTQIRGAQRLKSSIEHDENLCNTDQTIILGDLNMNPFDYGLINASAIHANSCREYIRQKNGRRTVQREELSMFYNPMWNFLGDINTTAGSYFYERSDIISYGWNTFDQVLFRPSLMDIFRIESLRIITRIGDYPLLDNNKPNGEISDHLPIFFEL
jgi:hypothetical protein